MSAAGFKGGPRNKSSTKYLSRISNLNSTFNENNTAFGATTTASVFSSDALEGNKKEVSITGRLAEVLIDNEIPLALNNRNSHFKNLLNGDKQAFFNSSNAIVRPKTGSYMPRKIL